MIPAAVTEWIRSIIVYMLLVSVLMNLLPDEKYQKYVRIFVGFVLLLLVTEPLRGVDPKETFAGIFSDYEASVRQELNWEVRVEEIRDAADGAGTEAVLAAYKKQIEANIAALFNERGYTLQEADVELTKDGIVRLSVCAAPLPAMEEDADTEGGQTAGEGAGEAKSARERQLCEALCEAYQLKKSAVSVKIEER